MTLLAMPFLLSFIILILIFMLFLPIIILINPNLVIKDKEEKNELSI